MFRKALIAAAALLALPGLLMAQTAPTYRTGVAASDNNPQPMKIMCWNGVSYYQCNPGSGGGGGGGTGDASASNQQAQIAQEQLINTRLGDITAPATGTVNQRLGLIGTTVGSLFKPGDTIGNTQFGVTQIGPWEVAIGTLPSLPAGTNTIGTVNLGTLNGAATAAAQATGNSSLSSIASALAGPLTVSTHAVTQSGTWSVGVTSLPALATGSNTIGTVNLGTLNGAATAANQTLIAGYVDGLEAAAGAPGDTAWGGSGGATQIALLKTIATAALDTSTPTLNIAQVGGSNITLGQKTAAASLPVTLPSDGTFATSALQTTGNASLASVDGKLPATLGPKSNAQSLATVNPKAAMEARSSVAVATSSTLVLPANTARMGCSIIFESSTTGYIGLSAAVSSTSYTYPLVGASAAPYTVFTCPSNWTGPVYAFGVAATGFFRVSELTQ